MLQYPDLGPGKVKQDVYLVIIAVAFHSGQHGDLLDGKGPQARLGIPKLEPGTAKEHDTGKLAAKTVAKLHVFVNAAVTQYQRAGMLLSDPAYGNGILHRVPSVAVNGNNDGILGKIILNVMKACLDGLAFARVLWQMQHSGPCGTVVKYIAAAVIAAVIYNNNGETGIAKITDQII